MKKGMRDMLIRQLFAECTKQLVWHTASVLDSD